MTFDELQREYRELCERFRDYGPQSTDEIKRRDELLALMDAERESNWLLDKDATSDSDYIICPTCGHQQGDCWEWVTQDVETDTCSICDTKFDYWAEYSVTYHAKKVS